MERGLELQRRCTGPRGRHAGRDSRRRRRVTPLGDLNARLIECRSCPRLVDWRERVAIEKRAAFADEAYWGRPVPSFGDHDARILVVGLAPAAHGANRTGRMFTGDRSGDWLFGSLHRTAFANQSTSTHRGDGLELADVWITAMNHCAPPANKPTPEEQSTCRAWLEEEVELLLPQLRAIVCLGGLAWNATLRLLTDLGLAVPRPRPGFGHLAELSIGPVTVFGSYHPSQQNTFTGRLTEPMLDAVFDRARALAKAPR
ncbi:MAG: uracil-DNA glycosylase [Acidimicrobiia bacterium]|nr:uracil-DNA glycosylase [Acidimicrobiia bacterium]